MLTTQWVAMRTVSPAVDQSHLDYDIEPVAGGAEHGRRLSIVQAGRRRWERGAAQRPGAERGVVVEEAVHGAVQAVRDPVVITTGA